MEEPQWRRSPGEGAKEEVAWRVDLVGSTENSPFHSVIPLARSGGHHAGERRWAWVGRRERETE